jgi:hypothetical protein
MDVIKTQKLLSNMESTLDCIKQGQMKMYHYRQSKRNNEKLEFMDNVRMYENKIDTLERGLIRLEQRLKSQSFKIVLNKL